MATLSQRHYPDLPENSAPTDGGLPIRDLLTALRRRQWLIFWTVVVLTTLAALIGLQATRTYTATALVVIEPQEDQIVDLQKVAQGLPAESSAVINTQITLIQSPEILGRAVDRLNLLADPRFAPDGGAVGTDPSAVAWPFRAVAGWLPDGLAELLPQDWLIAGGMAAEPADESAADDPTRAEALRRDAIGALQGGLKVAQSDLSYVLSVSYTSTNPGGAARIANGVADAYVEGRRDQKLAATRRANLWLAERVEELREQVLEAEQAIEEYRAAHGLVGGGPEGGTLDAQQLAALIAELIDARAERTTKEARLRRIRELQGGGGAAAEAAAEVLSSPLLMSLRQRELDLLREEAQLSQDYGARHPRLLQLQAEKQRLADGIRLEVSSAIRNLENEIAVARSREQALQESLDEAKGYSALTGQAGVQLRELEREAAATRSLYETFLIRLKETEEQQQIIESDARVIAPAQVPGAPSSMPPQHYAAAGFAMSLVVGMMLALLLEQLDTSMRTARQVEQLLGTPVLGFIPSVAGLQPQQRLHTYLLDKPRSAYAEGVRRLYTQARLRLDAGDRTSQVVLVTSALPGEGKTSVAASLAAFAAELRHRVLLVDLDLRRPTIAREFALEPGPGLVELLAGEASLGEVVRRDEATGVDVLPVDATYANPSALLTSERLHAILRSARERYDCIILDTPPLLGVSDAEVLSLLADGAVFVVQWDRTTRDAAQAAVKGLREVSANVLGAVLTQVDLRRHAYYGYGDAVQYYGEYKRYYSN